MIRKKLDIIDFKNRPWLFFFATLIYFGIFIFTFLVYFSLRKDENSIWFLLTFLIFILEIRLISIVLSRFRYVPNGKLNFDESGINKKNSTKNYNLHWNEISEIKYYYRGDRFIEWEIGGLKLNRGWRRYHDLRWFGDKILDEKMIDRIDLNGETIYVKIRNADEKNTFHELISLSIKKGCIVDIMDTKFTTKSFGKVIDIYEE